MTRIILQIYEALKARSTWRWTSLSAMTVVLLALLSHQTYQENISDFLPMDAESQQALQDFERHAGADRIIGIFECESATAMTSSSDSLLTAAIDSFVETVAQRDSLHIVGEVMTQPDVEQLSQMMAWLYDHVSYFMTPDDYQRIDSLLCQPDYVGQQLTACKQLLMFPVSGLFAQHFQRDPLNLFTPVVARLRQDGQTTAFEDHDGYLVSADGRRAMVIMRSQYGASETQNNSHLVDLLQQTAASVRQTFPSVDIRFVGGPVIAVGNARQIKDDSVLAVSIAVLLIVGLLFFVFRRVWPLMLIVVSIGWGWLFAMGMLALIHDGVSIIVIGISSVILGIAVNYPLHLIAHLRHVPDMRSALKEITMPLVVGNITTVGAFLALVPLKSVALRDLGLFSALLLVGTILFVLFYLPHLIAASSVRHATSLPTFTKTAFIGKRWMVALVALLTIVFGYYSLQTSFDADMNHINYMTDQQRADQQLLGAASLTTAARPTSDSHTSAALWNDFVSRHADTLQREIETAAAHEGFSPGTFDDCYRLLHRPYTDMDGFASRLVQRLSDDFNYIGVACGCIVFFFLWFSLGSIELAMLSFLPMAVSWVWILGMMSLLGIQFNVVNIILATFIFGQGDDYTIFMTEGCQYEYARRRSMLASYKQSIILSAVIMFIGIGTLVIARHPALQSLGQVTIVGMFSVVLMSWLIPPFIFRWLTTDRHGRERRRPLTLRALIPSRPLTLCGLVLPARPVDPYRFVSDRYRYRGVEISFAVNRRLRYLRRHPETLPATARLTDEGWGETAMLCALLHPETHYYVTLTDEDRQLVARYAAECISNLTVSEHHPLQTSSNNQE